MKLRTLIKGVAAGAAAIAFSSGVFAMGELPPRLEAERYGAPATKNANNRVIKLDAQSRGINVTRGETVTIVHGDKSFTWTFDTLTLVVFELEKIAPKDFGAGQVRVYVAPNELDIGG